MARGRRPAGGDSGSGLTVSITGLDHLAERLEDLPDQIRTALLRAVKESAEDVQRETLLNVRKDSGDLQRHLKIRYEKKGLRAKVGWFNDADYYARFNEFGTVSIRARPALRPAIEAERGRIRERISDEIRKELGL